MLRWLWMTWTASTSTWAAQSLSLWREGWERPCSHSRKRSKTFWQASSRQSDHGFPSPARSEYSTTPSRCGPRFFFLFRVKNHGLSLATSGRSYLSSIPFRLERSYQEKLLTTTLQPVIGKIQTAKVSALPRAEAHKDDSNNTHRRRIRKTGEITHFRFKILMDC